MTQQMTSRERVLAAIQWEEIDQLPVFSKIRGAMAKVISRKINRSFYTDGEAMADAALATWEKLQDDTIHLGGGNVIPFEALGAETIWPDNDYPMFKKPSITSGEDVDKLQIPDPAQDPYMVELIRAIRIVRRKLGKEVIISSGFHGVFNVAGRLLGTENLMLLISRDPKLVHKLCRKITDTLIKYAELLVAEGAEILEVGDATSSPACISPKTYREMVLPYMTETFRGFKKAGAYAMYHPCGGEYPIIDLLSSTEADILDFSELVDLDVAQKIFVRRIAVSGTVNPSQVLFLGTPEEVDQHVKNIIQKLPFKTGTIIAPGCGLSLNIPLANVKAMIDAVRKYGNYLN
ncbi:MAG TPA: hypothetical protein DDW50_07815 [Firmicutes bacterium]|nr:hypothetical protein [Bacillota bacterium]